MFNNNLEYKEITMPLEEYVKDYYDIAKKDSKEFIKYLDFINDEIGYFKQLYHINIDIMGIYDYQMNLKRKETLNIAKQIMNSIDLEYSKFLDECLKNKKLNIGNYVISCTDNTGAFIKENNNISDVFAIIHEFMHYMHLGKYNFDMTNNDWLFLTEMISISFEFYTLFKLYEDSKYQDDVVAYFMNLLYAICIRNFNIIHESLILNIYHEDAPYVFGFPLAIYIGNKMAYDENYLNKVINEFNNINNHTVESFLKTIDVYKFLSDDNNRDNLYLLMNQINELLNDIYSEKEVSKVFKL